MQLTAFVAVDEAQMDSETRIVFDKVIGYVDERYADDF